MVQKEFAQSTKQYISVLNKYSTEVNKLCGCDHGAVFDLSHNVHNADLGPGGMIGKYTEAQQWERR